MFVQTVMCSWPGSIPPLQSPGAPHHKPLTKARPSYQVAAAATTCERVTTQLQHTPADVFICDEESTFYSNVLARFFSNCNSEESVIEFGTGDGSPVLNWLSKGTFDGNINGYELNPKAASLASKKASQVNLDHIYRVQNSCFFKGMHATPASYLIANPPYIPAPDNDLLMPELHGGPDGSNLTWDLMSLGFDNAVLLISAYGNPVETVRHAKREGYKITDYMVTKLPFGHYSSEPKVRKWLQKMKGEGKAFFADDGYLLAGILLQKEDRVVDSNRGHAKSTPPSSASLPTKGIRSGFPSRMDTHKNNIVAKTNTTVHSGHRQPSCRVADMPDLADELLHVLTSPC